MADIIDNANDAADVFFRSALSSKAKEGPPATGYCHNCEEKIEFPNRWCDEDCRADWARRENSQPGAIYD